MRVRGPRDLLGHLPGAIASPPGQALAALACSLAEHGATGRVALAWRWALTGACPSPVTLAAPAGRPPGRDELVGEADAPAGLGRLVGCGAVAVRTGGEVEEAYFWTQLT